MKIVELSCNGIASSYSGKVLETNYLDKVVAYDKFDFASTKDGFLFIKFSDYVFNNVLRASSSGKLIAKHEIIAEFFGRVENEKEIVTLGKYYLLLLQERRFENGIIKEAIGFDKFKAPTPDDAKLFQKNVSFIGGGV